MEAQIYEELLAVLTKMDGFNCTTMLLIDLSNLYLQCYTSEIPISL
jgi:hypothetical protein